MLSCNPSSSSSPRELEELCVKSGDEGWVEQSSLYKLLQQQLATARSEVAEAEARRAALQAPFSHSLTPML